MIHVESGRKQVLFGSKLCWKVGKDTLSTRFH